MDRRPLIPQRYHKAVERFYAYIATVLVGGVLLYKALQATSPLAPNPSTGEVYRVISRARWSAGDFFVTQEMAIALWVCIAHLVAILAISLLIWSYVTLRRLAGPARAETGASRDV